MQEENNLFADFFDNGAVGVTANTDLQTPLGAPVTMRADAGANTMGVAEEESPFAGFFDTQDTAGQMMVNAQSMAAGRDAAGLVEDQRIKTATGLDPSSVEQYEPPRAQLMRLLGTTPEDFAQQYPGLAEKLSDSRMLTLARKDIGALRKLADNVKKLDAITDDEGQSFLTGSAYNHLDGEVHKPETGGVPLIAWSAIANMIGGVAGMFESGGDVTGAVTGYGSQGRGDWAYEMRKWAERESKNSFDKALKNAQGDNATAKAVRFLAEAAQSGSTTALALAVALPLSLAGAPVGATVMGLLTAVAYGSSYGEAKDQGLSIPESVLHGGMQATIEYVTEKIPVSHLVKSAKGSDALNAFKKYLVGDILGEQISTLLGDLESWVMLPENKDKTFSQFLGERPEAALKTLAATLAGSGQVGLMVSAINGGASAHAQAVAKAKGEELRALERGELVRSISDIAVNSEMARIAPAQLPEMVQAGVGHKIETMTITSNAFMQEDVREKVLAAAPELRDDVAKAVNTGTDVVVPIETMVKLAEDASLHEGLYQDVKFAPGQSTVRQARERLEQLAANADKVVEQAMVSASEQKKIALRQIENNINQMLAQTGMYGKTAAKAQAQLYVAFFNSMSRITKIPVQDLYNEYGPQITARNRVADTKIGRIDVKVPPLAPRKKRMTSGSGFVRRAEVGAEKPRATFSPTVAPTGRPVVLQNRDRSRPGLVMQMTNIAANPIFEMVSGGNMFGEGAPVVAYGAVPESRLGNEMQAVTAKGQFIPVRYAVVEADTVLTSNNIDGTVVDEYNTAPTTSMRAIAGNGRMTGLRAAYDRGNADEYRRKLTDQASSFGVDANAVKKMKKPVLVRVMPAEHVTADIGDISNMATTASMSVTERARNDAERIDFERITFTESGEIDAQSVKDFIAQMPTSELSDLVTKDGHPTRQAHERFLAAVMAKAYQDERLLELAMEANDAGAQNFFKALARVAPKYVRLVGTEYDMRHIIIGVAQKVLGAQHAGVSLDLFLRQRDAFNNGSADIVAEALASRMRSPNQMADVLAAVADYSWKQVELQESGGLGLFDDVIGEAEIVNLVARDFGVEVQESLALDAAQRAPDTAPAAETEQTVDMFGEPVVQADAEQVPAQDPDAGEGAALTPEELERQGSLFQESQEGSGARRMTWGEWIDSEYRLSDGSRPGGEIAVADAEAEEGSAFYQQERSNPVADTRTAEANKTMLGDILKWQEFVDKVKDRPRNSVVMLEHTPAILQMLGAPSGKIRLAGHLFDGVFPNNKFRKKHQNSHPEITREVLKQIPERLSAPLAVYRDHSGTGDFVFVLDLTDSKTGGTIVLPVSGKAKNYGVAIGLTAFAKTTSKGKKNDAWFVNNAKDLVYMDEARLGLVGPSAEGGNTSEELRPGPAGTGFTEVATSDPASDSVVKDRVGSGVSGAELMPGHSVAGLMEGYESDPLTNREIIFPKNTGVVNWANGLKRAVDALPDVKRDLKTQEHLIEYRAKRNVREPQLYQGDGDESADGQQQKPKNPRGTYNPADRMITLFENANLSTFLHESGHFFLDIMGQLAAREDSGQRIKDDMQTLLNWFGVPDVQTWNSMSVEEQRPYHEKFARGFEKYLRGGKAPSNKLMRAFATFRRWLLDVYDGVKDNLDDVQISDEVRAVMDRMVASDREIKNAQSVLELAALWDDRSKFPGTDEEWMRYQELIRDEDDLGRAQLAAVYLRELEFISKRVAERREELERDQLSIKEAEEEKQMIRDLPVYKAWDQIVKQPINAADVDYLPSVQVQYLREQGLVTDDGYPLETVASVVGYDSGAALVEELVDARPLEEALAEVDSAREALAGDNKIPKERMEKLAEEMALNDLALARIEEEYKTLQAVKDAPPVLAYAKSWARREVGELMIRVLPHTYYADSAKQHGKDALNHAIRHDSKRAAESKRRQLMNAAAAREVDEAQNRVLSLVRKATSLRSNAATLARTKQMDHRYIEQALILAVRWGLIPDSFDAGQAPDWRSFKAQAIEDGMPLDVVEDHWFTDERNGRTYEDLTVNELDALAETFEILVAQGQAAGKVLIRGQQVQIKEVAEEIEAATGGGKPLPVDFQLDEGRSKIGLWFRNFALLHRRLSSMIHQMVGPDKADSKLAALMLYPLNAAASKQAEMRNEAAEKFGQILKKLGKVDWNKTYVIQGFRDRDGTAHPTARTMTKKQIIGALLNAGNDSNIDRLHGNWISDLAISNMFAVLNERELNFLQDAWDLMESYWPQVAETERRTKGVAPKKVNPRPRLVHSSDGKDVQLRGGYYRLVYDPEKSPQTQAHNEQEIAKGQYRSSHTASTTRQGHTKNRVDQLDRPLLLDPSAIGMALDETIHDICFREVLLEVNKALRDGDVRDAIVHGFSAGWYKTLRDHMGAIATDGAIEKDNALMKLGRAIARNIGFSAMAGSFNVIATQPLGMIQSISRLGVKYVVKGSWHWINARNFDEFGQTCFDKSAVMRTRRVSLNTELSTLGSRMLKRKVGSAQYDLGTLWEKIFYLPAGYLQLVVDVPTWYGAYEMAKDKGFDETACVQYADDMIKRTQGGGDVVDQSGVQRELPLMSMFYSYFNSTLNLIAERADKRQLSTAMGQSLFVRDIFYLVLLNALASDLLLGFLRGDDWEDWDLSDWMLWGFKSVGNFSFGLFVGLRDLGGMLFGGYSSYTPTWGRVFNDIRRLWADFYKDGKIDAKSMTILGDALRIPTTQIKRSAEGIQAYVDGKTDMPTAIFAGAPKDDK